MAYPQQGGYSSQQGGHPPQHPGGYPQQQGGYGYPQQGGGYPAQQGIYAPPFPPPQDNRPFPPGWISQWDPNSNRAFFVEQATGRTVWEDPRGPLPPPTSYAPPPTSYAPPPGPPPSSTSGYPVQQQAFGVPPPGSAFYGAPSAELKPSPQQYGTGYGAPVAPYGVPLTANLGANYTAQQPQSQYGAAVTSNIHPYYTSLSAAQVKQDSQALRQASHGMGTDEKEIIRIIANKSPGQLQQIAQQFEKDFKKRLRAVLKEESIGQFGELMEDMLTTENGEMEAMALRKAMAGSGTNEKALIYHLVGKSQSELHAIVNAYATHCSRVLQKDLKSELSGDLEYFFLTLLEGRPENIDPSLNVESDVKALYKAGPGKIGTDEKTIINIILKRPTIHLRKVFQEYANKYKDIEKMIKSEFSGDLRDALIGAVKCVKNRSSYIAEQFEDSMAGLGTNDRLLRQLTVKYRSPEFLPSIKAEYQKLYGKNLVNRVQGETSGDYQKLLVAILSQF